MLKHTNKNSHKDIQTQTYWTAIDFINNIKDLFLAFGLPFVLVDVTVGRVYVKNKQSEVQKQLETTSIRQTLSF